jgi:8-oxo-dGTP pyrophosphatase MutT (NUDIX family)
MGAGILPIAKHNGKIYMLLGKENKGGWSDFGGGREKGESLLDTAVREGTEELNGFLGNETEMRRLIKEKGLGILETEKPVYKCYLVQIDYDKNLPNYFNSNFKLMNRKLKNEVLKHNGLFEKSEIKWVKMSELKNMQMRRYFYHAVYPLLEKYIKNAS